MSYKRIGNYIHLVDNRNKDLAVTNLLGVSIQKKFIPSIANISGTDMSVYRVIKRNQFAYSPVTSRNGEKLTIALLKEVNQAILSPAYQVFEVIDENVFQTVQKRTKKLCVVIPNTMLQERCMTI